MDENSETSNFVEWLWRGLTNLTGLSAKPRSDREEKFGKFLLVSQVAWLALPPNLFKFALHISQMLLGTALMLHGNYLKSLEKADEASRQEREWERKDVEFYKRLREGFIRQITERDGIGLDEATKKADEMVWFDSKGKKVSPPWIKEEIQQVAMNKLKEEK